VRHSAGNYPQAIVERSVVVHHRKPYLAFLLAVSETSLLTDAQLSSPGGLIELFTRVVVRGFSLVHDPEGSYYKLSIGIRLA
jgi:hypothetical protein